MIWPVPQISGEPNGMKDHYFSELNIYLLLKAQRSAASTVIFLSP